MMKEHFEMSTYYSPVLLSKMDSGETKNDN
jgi:hypothetical protein